MSHGYFKYVVLGLNWNKFNSVVYTAPPLAKNQGMSLYNIVKPIIIIIFQEREACAAEDVWAHYFCSVV